MQFLLEKLPPKIISPKTHHILDYLTIGAFFAMGAIWWKSRRRAAIAAIANGAFVAVYTPLTDYEGEGNKPVSLQTHRDLDRIQAGMAALAPNILRFGDDASAHFFRGQALNETAVIGMTDWSPRRKRLWQKIAA